MYQVFYIIKKNRTEHLRHMFIQASNAKEACRQCKEQVKIQTGRNAFYPTVKPPSPKEFDMLTGERIAK